MRFVLAPQAEASGYRLQAHEVVEGSTNTIAMEHARAGGAGGLWVVTTLQRGGRGRRGRVWETPPGNLAASLLVEAACEPALAASIGFVAGLALHEAAARCAPGARAALRLKWPNDLLLDGAKLSGMLLESEIMPGGRRFVVVGVGVNVAAAPAGLPYAAAALRAVAPGVTAQSLFEVMSATWIEYFSIWDNGRGMDRIRRLWLERAHGVGGAVAIQYGPEVIRGVFETIDAVGQLVVRTPAGDARTITAGDVHFGDVGSFRGEAAVSRPQEALRNAARNG
ncbi:biotin--[acetyl-CoA-carboxylase] ligase [Camelimonas abortus]|uniref:biotin--[biotin carboxyl-carrier protein] ligase n=1 Tax=Camelimonas abortus TaxID=1017184 RepID=A0ABV7LFS5_9HYPH